MTRVVLVSGKGGVGKTTIAAATALRAAQRGRRTAVVSLDRAHNLGDVLGARLGPEPAEVPGAAGLHALEADAQEELERHWGVLSGYFARLLEWAGLGGAEADEVAIFPGLEELLVLSRLDALASSGAYELLVVDLAPTASSLRLLSFPELMAGPIGRMARWERTFLRATRPAIKRLLSAPLPEDELYEALDHLAERIGRLRALLTDPARAVVRLASIPERVVIDETRSAFTLLSLFGLCVDAVALNRLLPAAGGGSFLEGWRAIQAREQARARELFGDVPLLELTFQPGEVIGPAALSAAADELYGTRDPAEPLVTAPPLRVVPGEGGLTVLELHLPHAPGRDLSLKQRGGELIITLGGWRRQLALPASLRGREVSRARFEGGLLRVTFSPVSTEAP